MKNVVKFIALALLLSNISFALNAQDEASSEGEDNQIFVKSDQKPILNFLFDKNIDAPAFTLFEEEKFPQFKGKVLLMYFWHVECIPCIGELGQLNELQRVLRPFNVEIISIAVGEASASSMASVLNANPLENLNKFTDIQYDIFKRMGAEKVPTSYIINPYKEVVAGVEGPYNWLSLDVGVFLQLLATQ